MAGDARDGQEKPERVSREKTQHERVPHGCANMCKLTNLIIRSP